MHQPDLIRSSSFWSSDRRMMQLTGHFASHTLDAAHSPDQLKKVYSGFKSLLPCNVWVCAILGCQPSSSIVGLLLTPISPFYGAHWLGRLYLSSVLECPGSFSLLSLPAETLWTQHVDPGQCTIGLSSLCALLCNFPEGLILCSSGSMRCRPVGHSM